MERIVIIGGSGFCGQELLKKINGKAEVIDIQPCLEKCESFTNNDITKPLDFVFKPDDIVIHLAANQYHNKVPRKNRQEFFDSVNFYGTKNVLETMEKYGAKNMVFFSTDMVYGRPQYLPIDNNHQKKPFGYYGKSKIKAENACIDYRNKGFNITIFRPRMIIGPGRLGILTKLFKLIDLNLPVPIIGFGNNCYQMVSVSDCTDAILLAIKKGLPNKEYNLGSKNPPKVKDLMKNLVKKANSHSFVLPTLGFMVKFSLWILGKFGIELMYKEQYMIADKNYLVDISETEKDLGWNPKSSDQDMLFEAYIQSHKAK